MKHRLHLDLQRTLSEESAFSVHAINQITRNLNVGLCDESKYLEKVAKLPGKLVVCPLARHVTTSSSRTIIAEQRANRSGN